ncbi:MAG: hypothetical protein RLZZ244_1273 [Verrucomicrobiota bacterium]|jgi:ABC-2 type transport system permease protein
MLRYLRIYAILLRNSLIREMSFKANFLLWSLVEILWFAGQIFFIEVLFSRVERIGDWSKWEVLALIGTHQVIGQIFQAFFYMNLTQIPELVRTGKLDTLLTLPIDAQFTVSTKQFGLDNLLNTLSGVCFVTYALHRLHITPSPGSLAVYALCILLGVSVHYSVMFGLSTLCFWIKRSQGLVHAYFSLFNLGRYPDSVFQGAFRFVFSWLVPVIVVSNVPVRFLTQPLREPLSLLPLFCQLCAASAGIFVLVRLLWKRALARYSSASS